MRVSGVCAMTRPEPMTRMPSASQLAAVCHRFMDAPPLTCADCNPNVWPSAHPRLGCRITVQHKELPMKVPSIASLVVLFIALAGVVVLAQARGGTPQTDKVQPVNSGANPYRVIRDWGKIEGREWGGSNGVAIDKDGKTVWAVDRCSPGTTPGCANTNANPVHHFDESGKEIRSFGGGMFAWPHGIHVDRDGNIWVADSRAGETTHKGSVVVKFAPDGRVLMTLGKAGVKGNPPDALTAPTVAITDPRTGAIDPK